MNSRKIPWTVALALLSATVAFSPGSLALEPERILDTGLTPSDTTLWAAEQRLDQGDPSWARNVCGGETAFDVNGARYEWTPVYSGNGEYGSMEPVSGWVLEDHESDKDVPFTHPFGGKDFTYLMRPDAAQRSLLAPRNFEVAIDDEHTQANTWGESVGLAADGGLLEVEQDRGLIPDQYRPHRGDRVAIFGRWIVDCGHDSWLSEIHPPLLTAVARASEKENGANVTHVSLISNPYLVSQEFPNGGLLDQLIHDVAEINFSPPLLPITWHIFAQANFLRPTSGLQTAFLRIRAPTPAPSPDHRLFVRMHLTARPGVIAQPFMLDNETLGVLVLFTDSLALLPITGWHDWDVSADELKNLHLEAGLAYQGIISEAALVQFDPVKLGVLAQGIRGLLYDNPVEPDLSNATVIKGWADESPWGQQPVTVNDNQAFPLIGWIEVSWGNPGGRLREVYRPRDLSRILTMRLDEIRNPNMRNSALETRMTAIGSLLAAVSPSTGVDGEWRYSVLIGHGRVAESGQIWLKADSSKLQGVVESGGKRTRLEGEISSDATKIRLAGLTIGGVEQRVELTRVGDKYVGAIRASRSRLELRRP